MAIVKPDLTQQWASDGDKIAPSGAKIQAGWGPEIPPYQWENFIQNRQDEMLAYLNERGIPEWDNRTNYVGGGKSYVQGSDGVVYKSVAASGPATTAQDPTTDVSVTYWTVAFASTAQATETVQGIVELATTAEAEAGLDDVRAMTPLKVKQAIDQFGSDFINTTRINVASASVVNLTSSAPNTRHINITGTSTINAFTVTAGQCYFVRFNAQLTLTSSASLVTQSGANILTAAGDTCILRATAANVVEVLCYTPAIPQSVGYRQTWQDNTASRAQGVTYTNTTGRPIMVYISMTLSSTNDPSAITVDGIGVGRVGGSSGGSNTFIVPNGGQYILNRPGLEYWAELR